MHGMKNLKFITVFTQTGCELCLKPVQPVYPLTPIV